MHNIIGLISESADKCKYRHWPEIMTAMRRAGDRRHSYTLRSFFKSLAALPDNITKLALDVLRSSTLLRWIQYLFPKAVRGSPV